MSQPLELMKVSVSQLRIGARLRAPIYDDSPRPKLLLAIGCELSQSQLEVLSKRGISSVLILKSEAESLLRTAEPARKKATPSQPAPARNALQAEFPKLQGVKVSSSSFCQKVSRPTELTVSPTVLNHFRAAHDKSLGVASRIHQSLSQTSEVRMGHLDHLAESQLSLLVGDMDAFLLHSSHSLGNDPLSQFSLQVSMLAAGIGTVMGLTREDIINLKQGCLLHDISLMKIPHQIRAQSKFHSSIEYGQHPLASADILSKQAGVPDIVKLIVMQIHERMDGSGFPRQRHGHQIHQLSRIASVADEYLRLTLLGEHGVVLSPHAAIHRILQEVQRGRFDATCVRALLHAVSLFPIGSSVVLNDGNRGKIIRAHREFYDRPVVEIESVFPLVVDLSARPELSIVAV